MQYMPADISQKHEYCNRSNHRNQNKAKYVFHVPKIDKKAVSSYINISKPVRPLRKQAKIGGFLFLDK